MTVSTEPITVHWDKEKEFHVPHYCTHLSAETVKSLKEEDIAVLTTEALVQLDERGML